MDSKKILILTLVVFTGLFFMLPSHAFSQTTTTVPEDSDNDGIIDRDDNCPEVPNGLISGTCEKIVSGVFLGTGVICTDSEECEEGEFCDMVQFDFNSNGIGDACECYADCNCDTKVNLADLVLTKNEFLRDDCPACATTSIVTTSVSTTTIPPPNPAPVEKTGQTTSWATGDDGDLEKGVALPNPRFTDNGDGTVADNLTGLKWLKDANCFGLRTWAQAISDCNGLASGLCGLTDGSNAGDWRLPNLFELESLRDMAYYNPILSNTAGTGKWTAGDPFNSVQSSAYWSSTTYAYNAIYAWYVNMSDGPVHYSNKTSTFYVWPVRGPQ